MGLIPPRKTTGFPEPPGGSPATSGTSGTPPAGTERPKRPVIVLLDKFKALELDLDGDGVPDESHGNAIRNMVRKTLPHATLESHDIGDLNATGYTQLLQKLKKKMDTGHQIDAINVSIGTMVNNRFTTLKDLSTFTGLTLTNDNVKDNLGRIRQVLAQKAANMKANIKDSGNPVDQAMLESWSVIQAMDIVTQAHPTKFYIAAGNEPESFNLLTLASNAIVVGGMNGAGKKLPNLTQNSLVSRYFHAETQVKPVYQNDTFLGFNYTGKAKDALATDIPKAKLSTFQNQPQRPTGPETFPNVQFTGTSIAVPLAIAQDMLKQFPQASAQ